MQTAMACSIRRKSPALNMCVAPPRVVAAAQAQGLTVPEAEEFEGIDDDGRGEKGLLEDRLTHGVVDLAVTGSDGRGRGGLGMDRRMVARGKCKLVVEPQRG